MSIDDVTLHGVTPANLSDHLDRFAALYDEAGVVILPGFFSADPTYAWLERDLKRLTVELAAWAGLSLDETQPLDRMVGDLARQRRDLVGKIYDVGTRPNKLLSGMSLKLHPALIEMVSAVFGSAGVLATPALSDTLHVFPPGKDSYRFNLPLHQDYPYLLQSPNQVTFWISLSAKYQDVGGMSVWRGSHKLGIRPHVRDAAGHLETYVDDLDLSAYEEIRCEADRGDLVVFHTNILHRSEKNFTDTETRIVQLFRFSDLFDTEARRIRWANADVNPKAPKFEEIYAERIMERGEAGAA